MFCEEGVTMSDGRPIGEIALLQVHTRKLVPHDEFDPAPLLQVDEASVDANGMLGWTGSAWVIDVHHAAWPGQGPRRPLSLGFSSHYDKMRRRYRNVPLGTAGENIVVRTDRVLTLNDLGKRLLVRRGNREAGLIPLKVAKPCLQFTSYMLELPRMGSLEELKEDLTFLGGGTRGFIVTMDKSAEPARIRVGDEVLVTS
jgi:hypothetical protein